MKYTNLGLMVTFLWMIVLEDRLVDGGGIRFATGRGGAWHRFNTHADKRTRVRLYSSFLFIFLSVLVMEMN